MTPNLCDTFSLNINFPCQNEHPFLNVPSLNYFVCKTILCRNLIYRIKNTLGYSHVHVVSMKNYHQSKENEFEKFFRAPNSSSGPQSDSSVRLWWSWQWSLKTFGVGFFRFVQSMATWPCHYSALPFHYSPPPPTLFGILLSDGRGLCG